jgi:dTDP-4-dehydrorhamnose reductase
MALKFLLLGANGQVGRALRSTLAPLGALVCSSRHSPGAACDLTDHTAVRHLLDLVQPDLIINAAAYTAVDRAESSPEAAHALNADVPRLLGEWATQRRAGVLHFSTDYVFDGDASHPYKENDPKRPINVYGQSKLAGEKSLQDSGCDHLILRTSWVYDGFSSNFLTTMLRLGSERRELAIVDDQIGSPTTAAFIARATAMIIEQGWSCANDSRTELSGTYHLTASGQISWFDFARAIFDEAQAHGVLPAPPLLKAILSSQFPTAARRPHWSVLDNAKLEHVFGVSQEDWNTGLSGIFSELAQNRSRRSTDN